VSDSAAFIFIVQGTGSTSHLEALGCQQITGSAGPVGTVGNGNDDPVLGDVAQIAFQFFELDVEEGREGTLGNQFIGTADIQHHYLIGLGQQLVDLGLVELLGFVNPGRSHIGSLLGRCSLLGKGKGSSQGQQQGQQGGEFAHGTTFFVVMEGMHSRPKGEAQLSRSARSGPGAPSARHVLTMALLRGLAGGFSRQVISMLFHEQQKN